MPRHRQTLYKLTPDIFFWKLAKWLTDRRISALNNPTADQTMGRIELADVERKSTPAGQSWIFTYDEMLLGSITAEQESTEAATLEIYAFPWCAGLWFDDLSDWCETEFRPYTLYQALPDDPPLPNVSGYTWADVFDWYYRVPRGRCRNFPELANRISRAPSTVYEQHSIYVTEFGEGPMPDAQSRFAVTT